MTKTSLDSGKLRESTPSETECFLDMIAQRDASLQRGGIVINRNPDSYEIVSEIGFGKYSRVFKSYNLNNELVVLKVLKPTPIKRVIREICILTTLDGGPNIIKFMEVISDPVSEAVTLVFEYVKNEINRTLYPKLTSTDIKYYMYQILRALDFSMFNNIMHRDVKPSNIMIDHSRKQLRLVDWGLAEYYVPGMAYSVRVSSLNFKGPELLLGYTMYDYSLDMWCLGCVFAEMLFCKHPFFHGVNPVSQIKEIVSVLGSDGILGYIDKYRMREKNFDGSILSVIMGHSVKPWEQFKSQKNAHKCTPDALDLLSKLLIYDHSERITPKKAMEHPYFDDVRKNIE